MTKEKIITLNQKHEQEGRYTTVDDCISTINEDRIKHNLKGIAYVYLTVEDGEPVKQSVRRHRLTAVLF